jgi:hypothetical protein
MLLKVMDFSGTTTDLIDLSGKTTDLIDLSGKTTDLIDLSGTKTQDLIHLLHKIQEELSKRDSLNVFNDLSQMMLARRIIKKVILRSIHLFIEMPHSGDINQTIHDILLSKGIKLSNIFHVNEFKRHCDDETHFEKFIYSRANDRWRMFADPDYLQNVLNILILPYITSLGINTDTYRPLRITNGSVCLALNQVSGTYIKVEIDRNDALFE